MDQGLSHVDATARREAQATAAQRAQRRAQWLRAILPWHWISSALTLVGLLAFALTGITLNHAGGIEAKPVLRSGQFDLSTAERATLDRGAPKGDATARAPLPPTLTPPLQARLGLVWDATVEAEWSADEIYLSLPRPGGDAWLRIERDSGAVEWEDTDRGLIAWLNDLHKARHTGTAWRLFIDIFAIACAFAAISGLLLLALHARRRPSTWPLVAAGLVLPLLLAVYAAH
jgi:hypothetical protein